jgi:hypothetical protein
MMRQLSSLGVLGLVALGALTMNACSSDNTAPPSDGGVGGATGTGGASGADAGTDAAKVTVSGAGSSAFIGMHQASHAPITGVRLFGVSKATEGKLAMFTAAFATDAALPGHATIVAGDLETRGFMLGTVINKVSEGGMPVMGAMVTTTDTRATILYPNADFSGVGTSTAAHGTILVVPKLAAPGSIVATWKVMPPSGDAHTWADSTAGTSPGTAFVLLFPASEQ